MEYSLPSDEILAIVVPILVYWVYSGVYLMLGSLDNYRLHSRKDEDVKNLVSKLQVVKGVLLQQLVQAAVAFLVFKVEHQRASMIFLSFYQHHSMSSSCAFTDYR